MLENVEQLLKQNPNAKRDENSLREALSLLASLREAGIERASYNIAGPFERGFVEFYTRRIG